MRTVITYGTFDLLHVGHVNLLSRLRALGDRLIVGCSTDEFNEIKGKRTIYPYAQRVRILNAVRFVDKVIAEQCWEQKRDDVVREGAAVFAIGDDWAGRFDDLEDVCEVIYVPRTADVSTTEIRYLVNAMHADKLSELRVQVERLSDMVKRF
ncbi:adenylyltransferase/cytidyltransferase family protein [Lysobacter capsici]|uniref:adenylyltransferase/cytidyltransferase family protein n=1 Tax=Lysobacter capsici TaxID=435897 RepID=UPI001C008AF3|nr:adenylyltransferase/cytidyltransferase family protein [Lysobacter capsici]